MLPVLMREGQHLRHDGSATRPEEAWTSKTHTHMMALRSLVDCASFAERIERPAISSVRVCVCVRASPRRTVPGKIPLPKRGELEETLRREDTPRYSPH